MVGAYLIIRAATRQEPKAVRSLKEAGYNAYCPERTVWNRLSRDKDAKRQMALFPGYVFVEEPEDSAMHGILEADGVHSFLWVHGEWQKRPATVPARMVEELIEAQEAGAFDDTRPKPKWRPKKGDRVQIAKGPFSGFLAEVMEARGEKRLRLFVEMFGKRQAMTVKTEQVRAA